jgi:MFS family permease
MLDRPRLRIMDLVVLIAATAVATAGANALNQMPEHDQGKVAFWLVFAGVLLVGYLAARFGRTPEVRLIVVGLAVAFAGAADAMFLDVYSDAPTAAVVACIGLTLASLVLLIGGVVHGLRARRFAAAPHTDGRPLGAVSSPHPLDRELIP